MKIKLRQIVNSQNQFAELLNERLPIATSFRLKRLTKELAAAFNSFNESREELCRRFGTLAGGQIYEFNTPESQKGFNDGIDSLLEEEVEIYFQKLEITDLGNIEVKPSVLLALDYLFVDDDPKDAPDPEIRNVAAG